MGPAVDPARLGRRALLAGAGGLFLSGCSGGSGGGSAARPTGSPTPSGPIVHEQDAGTVITRADIDALLGRMDAAIRNADAAALKEVAPKVHVPVWQRRLDNLARFPLDEIGFAFDDSLDRQVNASGGRVETTVYIALTHRIAGVDARPVVQIYGATLLKADPEAPVRIVEMDDHPDDEGSPAAWDLEDWDAVEAEHVVVAARREDIGLVRSNLATIDEGVAAALALIPPPPGVERTYLVLADPESRIYESNENLPVVKESDGFAMRVGYIDPSQAAKSGKGAGAKAAYAGSRLVLHPGAFSTSSRLREVAMHESIHGLAFQWGDADPWPTEGLATWGDSGGRAGLLGDSYYGPMIRSGFAGFAERMRGDRSFSYEQFHGAYRSANYACAAAVYAYLESRGGRDEALEFARLAYADGRDEACRTLGDRDQQTLFGKVLQWTRTV